VCPTSTSRTSTSVFVERRKPKGMSIRSACFRPGLSLRPWRPTRRRRRILLRRRFRPWLQHRTRRPRRRSSRQRRRFRVLTFPFRSTQVRWFPMRRRLPSLSRFLWRHRLSRWSWKRRRCLSRLRPRRIRIRLRLRSRRRLCRVPTPRQRRGRCLRLSSPFAGELMLSQTSTSGRRSCPRRSCERSSAKRSTTGRPGDSSRLTARDRSRRSSPWARPLTQSSRAANGVRRPPSSGWIHASVPRTSRGPGGLLRCSSRPR